MQVFRVVFIHEDNDFDLGSFSNLDPAEAAVENARTLPGFCDIPENVYILPYQLIGVQTDHGIVYDTSVYCHDEYFNYEHCYHLGVFGNIEAAEKSIAAFERLNPGVKNADYETEVYNVKTILDKVEWEEGFTSN